MKLLLRREQRSGLLGKVIFALEVRADLSDEERAAIKRCRLGEVRLFQRFEHRDERGGVAGVWANYQMDALDIEVLGRDLTDGKRLEFPNIEEVVASERAIRHAADRFAFLLRKALSFAGEDVIDFDNRPSRWDSWMES